MAPDYHCWYQYVIVRKDMPVHYHIIQACHAVQEATIRFGRPNPKTPIHLILLEVDSEEQLKNSEAHILEAGIQCEIFYEPDYQTGRTAVACELMSIDDPRRDFMKNWKMYRS